MLVRVRHAYHVLDGMDFFQGYFPFSKFYTWEYTSRRDCGFWNDSLESYYMSYRMYHEKGKIYFQSHIQMEWFRQLGLNYPVIGMKRR